MKTIVFVDYWSLQLSLQREESKQLGLGEAAARLYRFHLDWYQLGPRITRLAARHATADSGKPLPLVFEQMRIYTSANPAEEAFRSWALNSLGHKPGVHVTCQERRPKWSPSCPSCHALMSSCPHCHVALSPLESSINMSLAADLMGMGLGHDYEVAVLVSQDADLGPVADCLAGKGVMLIQAGVGSQGKGLALHCRAEFDLFPERELLRRAYRGTTPGVLYRTADALNLPQQGHLPQARLL